jgi:acyl-CoA thioester hydrolase
LGVIAVNVETPAISGTGLEYGFFAPVSVYLDDLDFLGMLYNSRFTVLGERAFVAYWRDNGVFVSRDWDLLGDGFTVVKEQRVSYELPVRAGEYGIHGWVEHIGRTSMTCGFRLCSADATSTYAHGSRTIVRLDRQTLRPCEWSDEARRVNEKLLRPATG